MKNKAATLIEILIAVSIVTLLFAAIFGVGMQMNSDQPINAFLFPKQAQAQAQQQLAKEIAEQNRLMREQSKRNPN